MAEHTDREQTLRRALDSLGATGVLTSAALCLYWLPRLPAVIPVRFGMGGQVLATGPRAWVLSIPGIALFTFLLLYGCGRVPARFYNYPWAITAENAERQYSNSRLLIASMNGLLAWFWVVVAADWTRTANGASSLGFAPTLVLLVMIGILIVGFMVRGWKLR